METIATNEMQTEGSFDLFCMFSIARQVINCRTMVSVNRIRYIYSIGVINLMYLCQNLDIQAWRKPVIPVSFYNKGKSKKNEEPRC